VLRIAQHAAGCEARLTLVGEALGELAQVPRVELRTVVTAVESRVLVRVARKQAIARTPLSARS
jgi:hypothetical protein